MNSGDVTRGISVDLEASGDKCLTLNTIKLTIELLCLVELLQHIAVFFGLYGHIIKSWHGIAFRISEYTYTHTHIYIYI